MLLRHSLLAHHSKSATSRQHGSGRPVAVRPVASSAVLGAETKSQEKAERKALKERQRHAGPWEESDEADKEAKKAAKKAAKAAGMTEAKAATTQDEDSDEEEDKAARKAAKHAAASMEREQESDRSDKEAKKAAKKAMKAAAEGVVEGADKHKDKGEKGMKDVRVTTGEELGKAERKLAKAEAKRRRREAEARGALYKLHWCVAPKAAAATMPAAVPAGSVAAPCATDEAKQFISGIKMDLERCEKVAKDAVWFVTKEASEGATHMVLVTANAKTAYKYGLEELPQEADSHVVPLGSAGDVEVPVAALRAMVLAQREEDSDSDSDEGDMGMVKSRGKVAAQAAVALPVAVAGEIQVNGSMDEATAAALAFAEMAEAADAGDLNFPPLRSFL